MWWKELGLWNLTALDPVPAPDLPEHSIPQSPYPLLVTPGFISSSQSVWEAAVFLLHFIAGEVKAGESLARDHTVRASQARSHTSLSVLPSPPLITLGGCSPL